MHMHVHIYYAYIYMPMFIEKNKIMAAWWHGSGCGVTNPDAAPLRHGATSHSQPLSGLASEHPLLEAVEIQCYEQQYLLRDLNAC